MKFNEKLRRSVENKSTFLCIGLDPDVGKFSSHFSKNVRGVFDFVKTVINLTVDLVPVYKFNLAFFEVWGGRGWDILEKLRKMIPLETIVIADGKRGDIGNSARFYAKALLENLDFDAVTLSPYLGRDSIGPFVENEGKGAFVLCVTSNESAMEVQNYGGGEPLYIKVAETVKELNVRENLGLVVGATKPEQLGLLRRKFPELPFLIPGVGAQGGSIKVAVDVCKKGASGVINVSRAILYPETGDIEDIRKKAIYYKNLLKVEKL